MADDPKEYIIYHATDCYKLVSKGGCCIRLERKYISYVYKDGEQVRMGEDVWKDHTSGEPKEEAT
jgi:hypothetical protein